MACNRLLIATRKVLQACIWTWNGSWSELKFTLSLSSSNYRTQKEHNERFPVFPHPNPRTGGGGRGEHTNEGWGGWGCPAYFPLPKQQFINGRNLQEDLLVIVDRRELCNVNHPAYYAPTYLYLQIDSLLNHNQQSESCLAKNGMQKAGTVSEAG